MSAPAAKRPSPSNVQNTTDSKQAAPSASSDPKRQKTAPVIVCPYLDTIDRKVLDFDFEKLCSISLSNMNVYACLVCGKYFQGRGLNSHAYFHSLDSSHHVFINLQTEKIYCLPDNYEVIDSSLEDIRFNLHPKLRTTELVSMDQKPIYTHALDGRTYMPGLVGLNNIKNTDWLNAVIQALVRIAPLRNFFAVEDNWSTHKTALVQRFGELVAKIWSPRSFKGHVSPHELLQAISTESNKQFKIGVQADPLVFLSWFLNRLHIDLGGSRKPGSSIIYKTFQGEIRIEQQEPILSREAERKTSGKGAPDEFSQLIKQQNEQEQLADQRAQEDADIDEEMAQAQAELEAQEAAEQADPLTVGLPSGPATADGVTPTAPVRTEEQAEEAPVVKNNLGFKKTVKYTPFLYLSLTLPAAPLFKDTADRSLIPQVPIYDLLNKFDGETEETTADGFRKKYIISRLPRYLIVHVKRFSDNNWFVEKNVTLVNFPIKNLDLRPYLLQPPQPSTEELRAKSGSELKALCKTLHLEVAGAVEKDDLIQMITNHYKKLSETLASRYDLIANIVHEGSRVPQEAQEAKSIGGNYKVHVYHKPTDTWYEIQDLSVVTTEMIAQQVALSEAYIQFYELRRPSP